MDVTALQDASSQNVEIIFYKFPYEFNIIDGEYPFISKLHIFGLDRKPTRIYQSLKIEGRNSISDIPSKSIVMDNDTNALYVTDLKLSLEPENTYKLIIE